MEAREEREGEECRIYLFIFGWTGNAIHHQGRARFINLMAKPVYQRIDTDLEMQLRLPPSAWNQTENRNRSAQDLPDEANVCVCVCMGGGKGERESSIDFDLKYK